MNINIKITFVKILNDNYVWIIYDCYKNCIIIDPGEHHSIIKKINSLKLNPKAIFLTHNHSDHVTGVEKILLKYPKISIYGPLETVKSKITHLVNYNQQKIIKILNLKFIVISTPGHTKQHVSYYCPPYLFCGDTLFSGGCGKIQNGMIIEMYNSFRKILRLPNNTLIYCSHEYTKSNLHFFRKIFPENQKISDFYQVIKTFKQNECTLPSVLSLEKEINPFLKLHDNSLRKKTKKNKDVIFELNFLMYLRKLKDKNQ